jgi:hypothetical protein
MGWTREYSWRVLGVEHKATVTVSDNPEGGADECHEVTVTSEGDKWELLTCKEMVECDGSMQIWVEHFEALTVTLPLRCQLNRSPSVASAPGANSTSRAGGCDLRTP